MSEDISNAVWYRLCANRKSLSEIRRIKNLCELRRTIKIENGWGSLHSLSLAQWWPRAEAQQPGKVFRIGFLDTSTASGSAVLVEAFRQELSKLGWIEGKNIAIEYRFGEQRA